MSKGRKKVRGGQYVDQDLRFIQKTNRYILSLFAHVNQVFSKGSVSYTLETSHLVIAYEDELGKCLCRVKFPIKATSRRSFDELKYCVQDFLLDCFYTHEYEHITSGGITMKALSIIMGVDHRSVFDEVVLIEAEIIRKFNEMFQL